MNNTAACLLSLTLAFLSKAPAAQETVGEWSAEHQWLKARFIARYEATPGPNGALYPQFLIYLELRNTSPAMGTVTLNLDLDPAANITYKVTDQAGREVERDRGPGGRSTIVVGTYHLLLPQDSNLRFPISLNGGGVFQDRVQLDLSFRQGPWFFDLGAGQQFKLSGTLRIPQVRGRNIRWWQGEIEIPPVKLNVPGPSAKKDGTLKEFPEGPNQPATQHRHGDTGTVAASGTDVVPRGCLDFVNAEIPQVLDLYRSITGKELDMPRNAGIPRGRITLQQRAPLPRSELVKLIETALREQGGVVLRHLDDKRVAVSYDDPARK